MLIVFEGIDGTGKTTLAARLAAALRASGLEVVETREPWSSPAGMRLRNLLAQEDRTSTPEEEFDLFHADRTVHVRDLVRPALARGAWVVQDRTYYSTAAYQGARGLDATAILRKSREIAPVPDLTLLLLLAPEKALERIARSRAAASSFERLDALKAVDRLYRKLAADEPAIVMVDAERPVAAVEADVFKACREKLGRP